MGGARAANRGPGSLGSRVGEGAPPRADLGVGIAVAAAGSTAGPAGPGAAGAGVGGGAGSGEGGRPRSPAAAARNLQKAAGPGEGGEGARRDAGGLGPAGSVGPSGRSAGKEGKGEGRTGSESRGPAAAPALRAEGGGGSGAAAFAFSLRERPGVAGPGRSGRTNRADGEISRCGASAEPICIWPGNVSERCRGTALYGERSFETAAEGGERASTARRLGAAAAAASPPPVPCQRSGCAPTAPRQPLPRQRGAKPGPPTLVPRVLPGFLTALLTGTAAPLLHPKPAAVGGVA